MGSQEAKQPQRAQGIIGELSFENDAVISLTGVIRTFS